MKHIGIQIWQWNVDIISEMRVSIWQTICKKTYWDCYYKTIDYFDSSIGHMVFVYSEELKDDIIYGTHRN